MRASRLDARRQAPMVERLRDQQRSSRGVTAHVVEGFGRVAKRRPDSDRKREPTELDEPRHFRKRFGFRSKQDPRIIARIFRFCWITPRAPPIQPLSSKLCTRGWTVVAWPSAPSRRHESNFDSSSHVAKLSVASNAPLMFANGLRSRSTALAAPAWRQAGRSDALAMAVTRAPHSERVCKANVPKPPAAPRIRISFPSAF